MLGKESVPLAEAALDRLFQPYLDLMRQIEEANDVYYKGPNGVWLNSSYAPCADLKYDSATALLNIKDANSDSLENCILPCTINAVSMVVSLIFFME